MEAGQRPKLSHEESDRGSAAAVADLVALMARLRSETGCPWDRAQSPETLKPYLIEEAYEVAEAIEAGEPGPLREELGDLLFQVVFLARIHEERGRFDLGDVARSVVEKMVRRHPHVFGDEELSDADEVRDRWEEHKEKERAAEGRSLLDGIPASLPALTAAHRISEKVAGVGFEWPDLSGYLAKLREEVTELEEAVASGDPDRIEDELGDVLFVAANVGRATRTHAEEALRAANRKFRRRFSHVEQRLRDRGLSLAEATLEQMDAAWDEAKRHE